MCSLHLTHPSAHTPEAVGSRLCSARGAVVDFLPEPGFEPTTLGYLGFQVQRSRPTTAQTMCKLLFVSMCSFSRITDKLLPFDLLSILILDKLCMHLICLYRYFL